MPAPTVMRGVVAQLDGAAPYVEIADLGVGYAFGPCQVTTGISLERGDRVLVVSVSGIPEDLVVINKLNPGDDAFRLQALFDLRYARLAHQHPQSDIIGLVDRLAAMDQAIANNQAGTLPPPYEQQFVTPVTPWVVPHGLGYSPVDCTITDLDDRLMIGDVQSVSDTVVHVSWAKPTTGRIVVRP